MSKCPVAGAFDAHGDTHVVYCGKWSCPRCSKRNASKWARRAANAVREFSGEEDGELWFLTLTLGSGVKSTAEGFSLLPTLWDTTRKQYQRYYGTFSYLAFVEGQPTRSFMPHFHILTTVEPPTKRGKRGYVTKHGAHDWAHSIGWGFECELLIVNGPEASAYVAKYASKQSPLTPPKFRRVRASRDWPKDDPKLAVSWILPAYKESIAHFMARAADFTGIEVEVLYRNYQELMQEIHDSQLDN